jgi:hypothetical protein
MTICTVPAAVPPDGMTEPFCCTDIDDVGAASALDIVINCRPTAATHRAAVAASRRFARFMIFGNPPSGHSL